MEDRKLRIEDKETNNQRMSRICAPAQNSINEDLEFTQEVPEDFKDNRVPTLDTT